MFIELFWFNRQSLLEGNGDGVGDFVRFLAGRQEISLGKSAMFRICIFISLHSLHALFRCFGISLIVWVCKKQQHKLP